MIVTTLNGFPTCKEQFRDVYCFMLEECDGKVKIFLVRYDFGTFYTLNTPIHFTPIQDPIAFTKKTELLTDHLIN